MGQLVVFSVWLAMAGGVLIVFAWERLRARYCGDHQVTPTQSESTGRNDA
jgi:hypothetical protein